MFCHLCGAEAVPGAKFCMACGVKLSEPPQDSRGARSLASASLGFSDGDLGVAGDATNSESLDRLRRWSYLLEQERYEEAIAALDDSEDLEWVYCTRALIAMNDSRGGCDIKSAASWANQALSANPDNTFARALALLTQLEGLDSAHAADLVTDAVALAEEVEPWYESSDLSVVEAGETGLNTLVICKMSLLTVFASAMVLRADSLPVEFDDPVWEGGLSACDLTCMVYILAAIADDEKEACRNQAVRKYLDTAFAALRGNDSWHRAKALSSALGKYKFIGEWAGECSVRHASGASTALGAILDAALIDIADVGGKGFTYKVRLRCHLRKDGTYTCIANRIGRWLKSNSYEGSVEEGAWKPSADYANRALLVPSEGKASVAEYLEIHPSALYAVTAKGVGLERV